MASSRDDADGQSKNAVVLQTTYASDITSEDKLKTTSTLAMTFKCPCIMCTFARVFMRWFHAGISKWSNLYQASNTVSRSEMVLDRNAYTVVKEGQAEVLFPSSKDVFYNPVQEFNRDLSVSVIRILAQQHQRNLREKKAKRQAKEAKLAENANKTAEDQRAKERVGKEELKESGESQDKEAHPANGGSQENGAEELKPGVKCETGLRVLEALAASGLRSCRFAREVGGLRQVVANDLSAAAVESMRRNVEHNGVQELVEPHQGDASMLMYGARKERFDVVDLDPYGSPAVFLDSAVQAVADGGVLQVTCTDLAILCGNAPETCHAKYGAMSVRSKMCHELALRIALQCVESHANRYGRYIEPLLSVSADFYIRLFVRIHTSAAKVKLSASKLSNCLVCSGCDSWRLQPLCRVTWNGPNAKYSLPVPLADGDKCPHCGFATHLCGPLWSAPLHDVGFVTELLESLKEGELNTYKRMVGVLSVIREELPDVPLYYDAGRLASTCRLSVPPMLDLRSALLNAGHRVSGSHCNASAIKTDAPAEFVWSVIRAWEVLHPAKRENIPAGSPAAALLAKPAPEGVSFVRHPEANPKSRELQLRRFQQNPEPHWGPKARAKTSISHEAMQAKQSRNQGKKRKRRDGSAPSPPPEESVKRERTDEADGKTEPEDATIGWSGKGFHEG
ncbi:putative tRNA (guanine(26)-N(2))-dimethyltransferase [Amphibalanus amphitrite]|uniref:tRNA (guanine(26)-N(2))-dimethyltransferase n=1 Tax=Amphibalanus amphitrite TaxID=1232801 RepID=A0A6A4V6G7_AMPAM|nr:putative tRNA (guanine(26)-N(2))-dimethyltransferase [Amphibalanus amphitrite]KAF0290196.1 putative tRNA (guanine(26)-N(2))-dimethyltransferase [Amphibalanus amphitrite]